VGNVQYEMEPDPELLGGGEKGGRAAGR